jgi:hypothetical protein
MQTTLNGNGKCSVVFLSVTVSSAVVDFIPLTILFALIILTSLIQHYLHLYVVRTALDLCFTLMIELVAHLTVDKFDATVPFKRGTTCLELY